jgi:iron-sulfur cluster repair protein YtfE (RIC family)
VAFDDPFAQLERSHRRLEERLDELRDAARDGAPTADALETLRGVAAYFARAVPRHEEDEEKSLFPRLAASSAGDALAPLLARVTEEHRAHEGLHARLASLVAEREASASGVPSQALASALEELAEALIRAYHTHVDEEERVLFPAARAALDDAAKAAIAHEMDARRGGGGGGGGRRR